MPDKKPYEPPQLVKGSVISKESAEYMILTRLIVERQALRDALRDLLEFYDRAGVGSTWSPLKKDDHGWNAADVNRLAEIRRLVKS